MNHNLMDCLVPPPQIERIIEEEIWPTHLMVCRWCFEVQLHSSRPKLGEAGKDAVIVNIVIVNPGNGSELCQVEAK